MEYQVQLMNLLKIKFCKKLNKYKIIQIRKLAKSNYIKLNSKLIKKFFIRFIIGMRLLNYDLKSVSWHFKKEFQLKSFYYFLYFNHIFIF